MIPQNSRKLPIATAGIVTRTQVCVAERSTTGGLRAGREITAETRVIVDAASRESAVVETRAD